MYKCKRRATPLCKCRSLRQSAYKTANADRRVYGNTSTRCHHGRRHITLPPMMINSERPFHPRQGDGFRKISSRDLSIDWRVALRLHPTSTYQSPRKPAMILARGDAVSAPRCSYTTMPSRQGPFYRRVARCFALYIYMMRHLWGTSPFDHLQKVNQYEPNQTKPYNTLPP